MALSDRIKQARKKNKLSQIELARLIGVSQSAVGNYETGVSYPKEPIIFKIMAILGVDANYLFQDEMAEASGKIQGNSKTWHTPLTVAYKAAVIPTREAACRVLSIDYVDPDGYTSSKSVHSTELDGMNAAEFEDDEFDAEEEIEDLRLFANPSAAGSGTTLFEDEYYEMCPFPKSKIPNKTDFAISITGNSMEPGICDGDMVFVQETPEVLNHQIGIFIINGNEAVCKRAKYDERGRLVRLMSDNPEVSDIVVSKLPDRYVRIVGRVQGVYQEGRI